MCVCHAACSSLLKHLHTCIHTHMLFTSAHHKTQIHIDITSTNHTVHVYIHTCFIQVHNRRHKYIQTLQTAAPCIHVYIHACCGHACFMIHTYIYTLQAACSSLLKHLHTGIHTRMLCTSMFSIHMYAYAYIHACI